MLKEAIDRIELPPLQEIPGNEEVIRSRQGMRHPQLLGAVLKGDVDGTSLASSSPETRR